MEIAAVETGIYQSNCCTKIAVVNNLTKIGLELTDSATKIRLQRTKYGFTALSPVFMGGFTSAARQIITATGQQFREVHSVELQAVGMLGLRGR